MVVFHLFSIYIFFCPEKIEKKKKIKPFALKLTSYPIIKNQRISETPPNPLIFNF